MTLNLCVVQGFFSDDEQHEINKEEKYFVSFVGAPAVDRSRLEFLFRCVMCVSSLFALEPSVSPHSRSRRSTILVVDLVPLSIDVA